MTRALTTHLLCAGVRLNAAWLGYLYAGLLIKTQLSCRARCGAFPHGVETSPCS